MRSEDDGPGPTMPKATPSASPHTADAEGEPMTADREREAGVAAPAPSELLDAAPAPSELLDAARAAFASAYVPYSGFSVGAALRADDGTVHRGCNVENASYGLSRCAEQSAVQAMVTAGPRRFTELVVFTHADHPASPCGACRQILFEFAPDARVYLVNQRGITRATTVAALLPDGFVLEPRP